MLKLYQERESNEIMFSLIAVSVVSEANHDMGMIHTNSAVWKPFKVIEEAIPPDT